MSNEVITHLRTKDDVTQELGKMEAVFQRFGSSVKSQFATIGAAIAGTFAVGKIVAFGRESVAAFSEAQEAEAKYVAMRKATNEETGISIEKMKELAAELQNTTKQEDDHLISLAASLLKYENLTEEVFPRTIKLAVDMAEVFGSVDAAAMQLGRALNDPGNAMRVLKVAGVELTETVREQIKAFKEAGDVAGAQELVFKELEGRFGGLGQAMGDTFAGRLAKLNNQFGDIKEMIGEGLIPAIESVFPVLEEFAKRFKASMKSDHEDIPTKPGDWSFGGAMQSAATAVGGGLANLGEVTTYASDSVTEAFARVGRMFGSEFAEELYQTTRGRLAEQQREMNRRELEVKPPVGAPEETKKRDLEYERLFGLRPTPAKERSKEDEDIIKAMDKSEEELIKWAQEEQEKWRERAQRHAEEVMKQQREPWADPSPEKKDSFTATIESMESVSRRIQTSLASRSEDKPEDKIIKVSRETTAKVVDKLDRAVEVLAPIAPKLDETNATLRGMESGLA